MSLDKFCGPVYGLEVLEICLPSLCFIRTVIFYLSLIFMMPETEPFAHFPCQPWSTHQLWKFMGMFGDHGDQRSECASAHGTFELSRFNRLPGQHIQYAGCVLAHTVLYLCSGRTAHTNRLLSLGYVIIHSVKHYFTVITGRERSCIWLVLQVVIILHIYMKMTDRERWTC